jgi:glyoxylase-like metal-dependent hydrolase (beta-lactamase superfamily II)
MFDRVPLPTPFQVGPVNAYLAGHTVVDPGPDSEEAWETLEAALAERGLAPADVEQVLVTHPHPDHFGLASRLREAGASVVASRAAVPILQDFPGRLDYERDFFRDFFVRCGMADSTAATVTDLPQAFVHYAPSVEVDRAVAAGDTVTVDGHTLAVDDLVGHATGEILFAFDVDGERQALVGDNVLADISPNPFLQPPPESGGERPRVLPAYNDSLATLREAGFDRFLTGHREPVGNPAGRIDAILDEHAERTERVADLVAEPKTPVEVMAALFGDLPATEQYMGMSEAVGHLDVLDAADRATVREVDGEVTYERVD